VARRFGVEQHAGCRPVRGAVKSRCTGCRGFHHLAISSPDPVGDARTMPRSWVMKTTAMPVSRFCRSARRSRICAWMVTSSAVVGSSAISTSGSLASAMAIITRWRCPPDSSCGYWPAGIGRIGMRTRPEVRGPRGPVVPGRGRHGDQRPRAICRPTVDRVERGHRLLEDHRDLIAGKGGLHPGASKRGEVAEVQPHRRAPRERPGRHRANCFAKKSSLNTYRPICRCHPETAGPGVRRG
jgi:hypothetical protein